MDKQKLGGDRLGSGSQMEVELSGYDRSTHDLGYEWRSTMAAGTVVPFLGEVMLPGDKFDIDLDVDVLTHPTIGPLFNSYKIQLDIFQTPIRLYQAALHMNKLDIGMNMSQITLPQIELTADDLDVSINLDNQQINSSCILSYLGIRGLGNERAEEPTGKIKRRFNMLKWLIYWDEIKNYYANKQEDNAFVIHNQLLDNNYVVDTVKLLGVSLPVYPNNGSTEAEIVQGQNSQTVEIRVAASQNPNEYIADRLTLIYKEWTAAPGGGAQLTRFIPANELFANWSQDPNSGEWIGTGFVNVNNTYEGTSYRLIGWQYDDSIRVFENIEPSLVEFPLKNIDDMKVRILQHVQDGTPFIIDKDEQLAPYSYLMKERTEGNDTYYSKQSNQEGLAVKTYQSDLFNNWLQTDWIDGESGINEITKVNVDDGGTGEGFYIDQLNVKYKLHKMLMRIGTSGGTYADWQKAVYTIEPNRMANQPVYEGGLIRELAFQSVISNAETPGQPLGTLGGRGVVSGKPKGGKVTVRASEMSYVTGNISITPRIDYSQGNKWDGNLKTMDDFHKPALDQIGFEELITDQMAFWDTRVASEGVDPYVEPVFKSAGKQPAWINYMTNVNETRGNFADENQLMFMTLNRRYEPSTREVPSGGDNISIKDLTTYIDPSKFNHVFAYTRRDAQNFWAQIAVKIKARRIMSAKVMPSL